MKTTLLAICMASLALSGCRHRTTVASHKTLKFYIVSNEQVEGYRRIDTPQFPKLGYVNTTPDFTVSSLASADPLSQPGCIGISLKKTDAAGFSSMTSRALGHNLLVELDETPVCAPVLMAPIPATQPNVSIQLPDPTKAKALLKELQELVE